MRDRLNTPKLPRDYSCSVKVCGCSGYFYINADRVQVGRAVRLSAICTSFFLLFFFCCRYSFINATPSTSSEAKQHCCSCTQIIRLACYARQKKLTQPTCFFSSGLTKLSSCCHLTPLLALIWFHLQRWGWGVLEMAVKLSVFGPHWPI